MARSRWYSIGPTYVEKAKLPEAGTGSPRRTEACNGLGGPATGTAVTPLMAEEEESIASTAATKYLDLTATHSNGPLRTVASPCLSAAKRLSCDSSVFMTMPNSY